MRPYYEHAGVTIYHGDCREVLSGLLPSAASAFVTDPPYELGFMGNAWDSSGVSFSTDVWREVLRVLKPGGHLLAFGGTRTYHRMTCAIEDAGFEIRDSLHWMFGTGFPKSLNVGEGRGTALKPGHEPIVLARKPLVGTVAANVQAHGTGALNIDGCRIGTEARIVPPTGTRIDRCEGRDADNFAAWQAKQQPKEVSGRWPANVLLDEDAAAELDAQSGVSTTSQPGSVIRKKSHQTGSMSGRLGKLERPEVAYGDTGGASRFFYVAKPSRKERGAGNKHPTVKPLGLMRWLCRLAVPSDGLLVDPFLGSGTTLIAARREGRRAIGIEIEERYCEVAAKRLGQDVLALGGAA